MVLTAAFCYATCQRGSKISIGICISEKGAVSPHLSTLTSFLFSVPFYLLPTPTLKTQAVVFPLYTLACDLVFRNIGFMFGVLLTASQRWAELEMFHADHSVSKQHDEPMKWHNRVTVLGLYRSRAKNLYL